MALPCRGFSALGVAAPAMFAATATAQGDIPGLVVFLDPGHNGVNDSSISRQVPDERGGMKDCQTTGTSTASGYPEHADNWDVVQQINAALSQLGVHTALSRDNDDAVGPCVDQRAAAANALAPNAIVSIHGDGGPASGRGFHVNYSSPPLDEAQSGRSLQFATIMRDHLVSSGIEPATYIGTDGLYGRPDLAGLNLARYPSILIELGNMRNSDDAAQMTSPDGRARYASAVVGGITRFLSL